MGCDALNRGLFASRGILDFYYFDQDACACLFDTSRIFEFENEEFFTGLSALTFVNRFGDLRSLTVQSPTDPERAFLQCQIDEIYNHNLGENCEADVAELPYDYRHSIDHFFGFRHLHYDELGELESEYSRDQFTEDGHFGEIEGCDGRVVHYVENTNMVCDGPCDEEVVQPIVPVSEPEPVPEPTLPIAQPDSVTEPISPIA